MAVLMLACGWAVARWSDQIGRHAGMLAIMAFVVANLTFLVGSLWGDVIGESWASVEWSGKDWPQYEAMREVFRAASVEISAGPMP